MAIAGSCFKNKGTEKVTGWCFLFAVPNIALIIFCNPINLFAIKSMAENLNLNFKRVFFNYFFSYQSID